MINDIAMHEWYSPPLWLYLYRKKDGFLLHLWCIIVHMARPNTGTPCGAQATTLLFVNSFVATTFLFLSLCARALHCVRAADIRENYGTCPDFVVQ
jgi:hypothetical protein